MRGPSLPPGGQPDLSSYDHVLVFTSGGKDSLACLLHLLEVGVEPARIELHHHEVDGRGAPFMDWPVTGAYVAATADAFDVPLYRSWRDGGFEREMLRHEAATARILFETPHGVMAPAAPVGQGHGWPFPRSRRISRSAGVAPPSRSMSGRPSFATRIASSGDVSSSSPESAPRRARPALAMRASSRTAAIPAMARGGHGTPTTGDPCMLGAPPASGTRSAATVFGHIRPTSWAGRGCPA